jgi:hypothetical protein
MQTYDADPLNMNLDDCTAPGFAPSLSRKNLPNRGLQPAPYSRSLLREPSTFLQTGASEEHPEDPRLNMLNPHNAVFKIANALLQQSFYIKSLPADKRPFSDTINRFLCLLASRNIPSPPKGSKMLEVLLDLFEYTFICSRHLELLVLLFDDLGRLKMSEHYGSYRVELCVLLFSNVVDIHNFEIVMRRLSAWEAACVIGEFLRIADYLAT